MPLADDDLQYVDQHSRSAAAAAAKERGAPVADSHGHVAGVTNREGDRLVSRAEYTDRENADAVAALAEARADDPVAPPSNPDAEGDPILDPTHPADAPVEEQPDPVEVKEKKTRADLLTANAEADAALEEHAPETVEAEREDDEPSDDDLAAIEAEDEDDDAPAPEE